MTIVSFLYRIHDKQESSKEVGNANAYLDEVLAELRQVLYQTPGIDPKTLPDAYTEISGGHAAIYNGWLIGLVLYNISLNTSIMNRCDFETNSFSKCSLVFIEALMLPLITRDVLSCLTEALVTRTCRYTKLLPITPNL